MSRVRHPEAHEQALIDRVPLGTVRKGQNLGFHTTRRFIFDACPCCDRPRWVPLRHKGRWCQQCVYRKASRVVKLRQLARGPERVAELVRLGRAAERAGLDLETLELLAEAQTRPAA